MSSRECKFSADFAVLGFYNAYDYFNHLRQRHLPRTDLSGLVLEFDIEYDYALDGAMRPDAAKSPSVSRDAMTFVFGKGAVGEIRKVKLLNYATVVSGGEMPAGERRGFAGRCGVDHIVVTFRDTQYNCTQWGKLFAPRFEIVEESLTVDGGLQQQRIRPRSAVPSAAGNVMGLFSQNNDWINGQTGRPAVRLAANVSPMRRCSASPPWIGTAGW